MKKNLWLVPALASAAFLAFSLKAALAEGPTGFLPVHINNGLWGYQVFIDLCSAATTALVLSATYAKKYGIRMVPWIVLTILTGSIGLFAFMARLRYAHEAANGKTLGTAEANSQVALS
jgi:hypothetical protein